MKIAPCHGKLFLVHSGSDRLKSIRVWTKLAYGSTWESHQQYGSAPFVTNFQKVSEQLIQNPYSFSKILDMLLNPEALIHAMVNTWETSQLEISGQGVLVGELTWHNIENMSGTCSKSSPNPLVQNSSKTPIRCNMQDFCHFLVHYMYKNLCPSVLGIWGSVVIFSDTSQHIGHVTDMSQSFPTLGYLYKLAIKSNRK